MQNRALQHGRSHRLSGDCRQGPRISARLRASATSTLEALPEASTSSSGLQTEDRLLAKQKLLELCRYSGRGLNVDKYQRGVIEEAQVALEGFGGDAIDYSLLEGKWRLIYTTASDVLPILELEPRLSSPLTPSPVLLGDIYQRFSSVQEGVVENLIQFGVPFLLEDRSSATFTVGARYEVRSSKRIALTFEEARFGGVRLSPAAEALLAPALLPRGSVNHALLLAIQQFQVVFPFRSAQQLANMATARSGVSAAYLLTYLDGDTLIGRATGLRGSFIFTREEEGQAQKK